MLIAFHKPYGVLSQFTLDRSSYRPLAQFGLPRHVYPIGRLDADSEGLLLLSDELDRMTLVRCDKIFLLPKVRFQELKGMVTEERRVTIARKLVEVLRLPLYR